MKIDLTDKTALITGATRGIGKEVADCFLEAGARLILTGTNPEEISAKNNALAENGIENITYMHGDFSSLESIKRFGEQLAGIDKIDICVNNAGTNIIMDFLDTGVDDFISLNNINLVAPYEILRVVGKKMMDNNYGRIVNVASIWSVVSRHGRSMYATSKHALVGLTKTLAIEWAPNNVLVNAVSPGFTLTELTRVTNTMQQLENIAQVIPAKRMAEPIEIARLILFLCSDLNTYITGQNITIDGGYTIV
jgi:3-oxoacyl-[acyl-carrier protein] reductase